MIQVMATNQPQKGVRRPPVAPVIKPNPNAKQKSNNPPASKSAAQDHEGEEEDVEPVAPLPSQHPSPPLRKDSQLRRPSSENPKFLRQSSTMSSLSISITPDTEAKEGDAPPEQQWSIEEAEQYIKQLKVLLKDAKQELKVSKYISSAFIVESLFRNF